MAVVDIDTVLSVDDVVLFTFQLSLLVLLFCRSSCVFCSGFIFVDFLFRGHFLGCIDLGNARVSLNSLQLDPPQITSFSLEI